jgi:hypothetical protein
MFIRAQYGVQKTLKPLKVSKEIVQKRMSGVLFTGHGRRSCLEFYSFHSVSNKTFQVTFSYSVNRFFVLFPV